VDRRETEQLLRAIRAAQAAGEAAALATIVRVHGSAYRREGTHMFVRADGTYECALSGGCLEPAVADAAARVIFTGEPAIVSYDLADDSLWGLGIGCSGAVDIRIERLTDDALTAEWLRLLEDAVPAVSVTPLSRGPGRLIVGEDTVLGSLGADDIERDAIAHARERLIAAFPQSRAAWIRGAELFFEVMLPPPQLVVFGAGDDAAPVAELAWTLGFAVAVIDARETFLTRGRFPHATLVSAHFSQFADKVPLPPGGFVIVMNHHVERDRESLRHSLASRAAHIGVLGPRQRCEMLLSQLADEGFTPDAESLARVRSPAGLALGADSAREVAVSILAEMLALSRGFSGGFLSGTSRAIHRPADQRALARS